jgi:hypothetical protein
MLFMGGFSSWVRLVSRIILAPALAGASRGKKCGCPK